MSASTHTLDASEQNNGSLFTPSVPASVKVEKSPDRWLLVCSGDWDFNNVAGADRVMRSLESMSPPAISLDSTGVDAMDTAGGWLIERLRRHCEASEISFEHIDGDRRHGELISVLREQIIELQAPERFGIFGDNPLKMLGSFMVQMGADLLAMSNIIGAMLRGSNLKTGIRGGIRPISVVHQLDHMAWRAIPVIAVMSFLIGAIIAQQGAFQLKWFGEELLTVNLVGILLLREIGVLLTAVMVAGRTGSAITAELGAMKMREEIDALRVIGLNPISILVFPRLLALVIAMPILTLLADFAGICGAIVVGYLYVGIPPVQFMSALQTAIDLSTLFAGLIKAPFMALVIGLVATVEGLKVGGSAESLGQRTTSAVVRSIFAVILMDGLFAIFYAGINY